MTAVFMPYSNYHQHDLQPPGIACCASQQISPTGQVCSGHKATMLYSLVHAVRQILSAWLAASACWASKHLKLSASQLAIRSKILTTMLGQREPCMCWKKPAQRFSQEKVDTKSSTQQCVPNTQKSTAAECLVVELWGTTAKLKAPKPPVTTQLQRKVSQNRLSIQFITLEAQ
jgi:hypothetical protein